MFDKILFTPKKNFTIKEDFIELIGYMMYFDEVHLILSNPDLFVNLFGYFNEGFLQSLLKSKRLILHLSDSYWACNYVEKGLYSIMLISHGWDDSHNFLYNMHRRYMCNNSIKNLQFADKFAPLMDVLLYPPEIGYSIYDDLRNDTYLKRFTELYYNVRLPQRIIKPKIQIDIELVKSPIMDGAFIIHSNIPELLTITNGYKSDFNFVPLLLEIANTRKCSYDSALYSSELSATSSKVPFLELLLNEKVSQTSNSKQNINAFQKNILFKCLSPGDGLVNRIIDENTLMDLLLNAGKFRNWLKNIPDDANLIQEYVDEINKKTKADNVWIKMGRVLTCLLFGWIPVVGPFVSGGLSMADMFFSEKLLAGWKPNLFVEDYKKVLQTASESNKALC